MTLDFDARRRLYFVGLGGMGMSALARFLLAQGHVVGGSDMADSPLLAELRAQGIDVAAGHDAARLLVAAPDAVVVSAAIPADNVEVRAARDAGVPVYSLAEVVGAVAAHRRVLAIGGTHGKSTTTAMIAYALTRAGHATSYLVGGLAPDLAGNARFTEAGVLVMEADEYAGRFLTLTPAVALVTNLEHDHPDVYPTWADLEATFRRWLRQVQPGGLVLMRSDDAGSRRLARRLALASGVRRESFGLAPSEADWTVAPVSLDPADQMTLSRGEVRRNGSVVAELRLRMPGTYNLANALAALAVCAAEGVLPSEAATTLAEFGGVGRRFEPRGVAAGVTVIDDYAHHPTAVRAVLAAARARYGAARLWCLFQPHTYSRTRALFDDFAVALRGADVAIILPVYAAREPDDPRVTADRLAAAVGPSARAANSIAGAIGLIASEAQAGDVVLTLGAGDVTSAGPALLAALERRASSPHR